MEDALISLQRWWGKKSKRRRLLKEPSPFLLDAFGGPLSFFYEVFSLGLCHYDFR